MGLQVTRCHDINLLPPAGVGRSGEEEEEPRLLVRVLINVRRMGRRGEEKRRRMLHIDEVTERVDTSSGVGEKQEGVIPCADSISGHTI